MGAKVVLNLMLEEKILTIYVRSKFLIYTNKIKKKAKQQKKVSSMLLIPDKM